MAEHKSVFALAIVASLVISAWCVYADPVVNNDGILYLLVAEEMIRGNWGEALDLYKWPFYPALIALVSGPIGVQVESAAHIVNALLVTAIVVAFMALVLELGGDRRTLVAAAVIVLLYPDINQYRSFVIRDFGYLAFYLTSLFLFVRHYRRPSKLLGLGWFASMLVATLFRVEGIIFLLYLPLVQHLNRRVSRGRWPIAIMGTAAVFVPIGLSFLWWTYSPTREYDHLAVLTDPLAVLGGAWSQISGEFSHKLEAIREEFLIGISGSYAYAIFGLTLVMIVVWGIMSALGPVYVFLVGHAAYRKLVFPLREVKRIWYAVILAHLGALCVFALAKLFLTGRYPLALTLTMLLAAPFSITWIYGSWERARERAAPRTWGFPVLVVLMIATGVEGLDVFTSKSYLREAGLWLNGHIPDRASLYSNNGILTYYAGRNPFGGGARADWDTTVQLIQDGRWKNYEYLAIAVSRKDQEEGRSVFKILKQKPIRTFVSEKGNRIFVFGNK